LEILCPVFNAGRGRAVQGTDRARVTLFDWTDKKGQAIWQGWGEEWLRRESESFVTDLFNF